MQTGSWWEACGIRFHELRLWWFASDLPTNFLWYTQIRKINAELSCCTNDSLPQGDAKDFHSTLFTLFAADNSLSFAELFGNLATSTPMKGNLQNFNSNNGSSNSNYIQATAPKSAFENFQVRMQIDLPLCSRILMISSRVFPLPSRHLWTCRI